TRSYGDWSSDVCSSDLLPGVSGSDAQGFVGHEARCDAGSTPAAAIRTSQSLAVVCQTGSGSYYYHGERLREGANVRLANAVPNRSEERRVGKEVRCGR